MIEEYKKEYFSSIYYVVFLSFFTLSVDHNILKLYLFRIHDIYYFTFIKQFLEL